MKAAQGTQMVQPQNVPIVTTVQATAAHGFRYPSPLVSPMAGRLLRVHMFYSLSITCLRPFVMVQFCGILWCSVGVLPQKDQGETEPSLTWLWKFAFYLWSRVNYKTFVHFIILDDFYLLTDLFTYPIYKSFILYINPLP